MHEIGGLLRLRTAAWEQPPGDRRPVGAGLWPWPLSDLRIRGDRLVRGGDHAGVGPVRDVGDEDQRAVEALAEPGDQQVVGLLVVVSPAKLLSSENASRNPSTGTVRTSSAAVPARADGQGGAGSGGSTGRRPCRAGFGGRWATSFLNAGAKNPAIRTMPATGRPTSSGVISRPTPTSAIRDEPGGEEAPPAGHLHHVAGESEQCGQQRDRRRHGECDGGGGADREALHEADAHQQHAQQGDDDGPAGEHDRPARGVDRDLDRLGIGCPSWRCSR